MNKVVPAVVEKVNSEDPSAGPEKLSFFFKLQEAINRRLLVGEVKVVVLSRFEEFDRTYVAEGYAEVKGVLKPLRVYIFPSIQRVKAVVGHMEFRFPLSEVDVE